MKMLNRFQNFVKMHSLCDQGDKILLTVSGGKDSISMLRLFHESNYSIEVAHCNFQLRGEESDREEDFVRDLTEKLQIPLHVKRFDVASYQKNQGVSLQMACRELRYAWFEELYKEGGFDKIATAHHLNDQIETVFINLLRGTGIQGLKGIPPHREPFIRPLLFATDFDIKEYLASIHQDFCVDSSNLKSDYSRNKIRLEVIPVLKEIQPSLESVLGQNIEHFSDLADFLHSEVDKWKQKNLCKTSNQFSIKYAAFLDLDPLRLWVYEVFKEFGVFPTMAQDILRFLEDLKTGKDFTYSGKYFETESYRIQLTREEFQILPLETLKDISDEVLAEVEWNSSELNCRIHENAFSIEKSNREDFLLNSRNNKSIYINYNALKFPLKLRFWREGDKFKPIGFQGKGKKLSNFFIEKKLNAVEKMKVPILVNGDGEIIWVVGFRSSENFKITEETLNIVRITHSISNDE